MDDALVGSTLGIEVDGTGFDGIGREHNPMGMLVAEMFHLRMNLTAFAVVALHSRRTMRYAVIKFDFCAVSTKEIAFFTIRPKRFDGELDGALFTVPCKEPCSG